jgi:hypothetical protein
VFFERHDDRCQKEHCELAEIAGKPLVVLPEYWEAQQLNGCCLPYKGAPVTIIQYQEKRKIRKPVWILQKAKFPIRQQQRDRLVIKTPI